MTARAYPLPRPESDGDPRFSFGLMYDVGKVLEAHGFPPVRNGSDHVDLMTALFGFVYASEARPVPAEDDSPLTFAEYRDAIPYWRGRVKSAESAGDLAAAERSRRCLKLLQERVKRAEATAQRGEWHVDISDEALAELASHAGAGVAK
ncbi:hypothetical protein ABIA35_005989 [Catenulispora sp. MAP12-49]|uniref:hypothetical protein n=1 Tax=Catenulispora sp. MAP12-49 TaxID=3156302 RepID=UPI0035196986